MWLQKLAFILGSLGFGNFGEPEHVVLQLPLTAPDAALFRVSTLHKKGLYTQYIISPKLKRQNIGTVRFGPQKLFDMPTKCDGELLKRSVVVTINGSGIFIKVHSAKKRGVDVDLFYVDTRNMYKMVWHWDYVRFLNPQKYRDRVHLKPFPVVMEVFTPEFKGEIKDEGLKYMAYRKVVDAAISRAKLSQNESLNKEGMEITGIKVVNVNYIPPPNEALYNSFKRWYREKAENNRVQGIRSIFRRAYTGGAKEDDGCVLTTRIVEEYMNLHHQGNGHVKQSVVGA